MNRKAFLKKLGIIIVATKMPQPGLPNPKIGEVREYLHYGTHKDVPGSEWVLCNGQSLSVREYPELFLRLGEIYGPKVGWDSKSEEFKVPDFRGLVVKTSSKTDYKALERPNLLNSVVIKAKECAS